MASPRLPRIAGELFGSMALFQRAPERERPSVPALRSHLLGLLEAIAKDPRSQAIPHSDLEEARFALVAWMDEVVLRSDWSGRDAWEREPLQLQLFRTNRAGDEFYEHLERLAPGQTAAREIYFFCLALGFEGGYVGHDADRRALMVRHYEMLRVAGCALDAASEEYLSPGAYDVAIFLPRAAGASLWPRLLLLGAVVGAVLGLFWVVLYFTAGRVALPPGV